ncbi:hypothetical protein BTJ40_07480 [Microbulbifer sp. A4B17]|uniref:hypothetical protein n=1 Tax=Microbulbifer sp. A4B17 TaxID=359370 RepID=UPI000D52BF81|nr:hypothetical protein [Microbulbifer sp. A4B17]AWF80667.1 hypothetical protein BTJ40_07480 [Microbulbifer sp. A4B17]
MKRLLTAFACLLPTLTYAGVSSDSNNKLYIKWIETGWSKDTLAIGFDRTITYSGTDPNCEWKKSVVIKVDDDNLHNETLSLAMGAQMANKPVTLYVEDECFNSRPELISIRVLNE